MVKGQKIAKSKKSTWAKKTKASKAKNLGLGQSRLFFTSRIKKAFIKLKQVFIKVLILNYFDLECHNQIETDLSSYAIGKVFN